MVRRLLGLCIASVGLTCLCAGAADVRQPSFTTFMIATSDCPDKAVPAVPATPHTPDVAVAAATSRPAKIDPVAFFQSLVERYHGMATYKDTASVVQITQRDGEEANRVETQITCEVADGKLKVKTPSSQARAGLGLNVPIRSSPEMRDAQLRYDLWLAPHMAMKFTDEPLKNMRAGVDEGFTATEAEPVTIDNKKMVHVALRSGDGLSQDCNAKFDLFINPESMLIERIQGEQKLPDGASYSTTLHITPQNVESPPSAGPQVEPTT